MLQNQHYTPKGGDQTLPDPVRGWFVAPADLKMRFSDGRDLQVGETLEAGSEWPLNAAVSLQRAVQTDIGPILCLVEMSGNPRGYRHFIEARYRKLLWMGDLRPHLPAVISRFQQDLPPEAREPGGADCRSFVRLLYAWRQFQASQGVDAVSLDRIGSTYVRLMLRDMGFDQWDHCPEILAWP